MVVILFDCVRLDESSIKSDGLDVPSVELRSASGFRIDSDEYASSKFCDTNLSSLGTRNEVSLQTGLNSALSDERQTYLYWYPT